MKIIFAEHGKNYGFWDTLKQLFYVGFYEWDEADYGFSIILFGHEFNWLIFKDKEYAIAYKNDN
jgi:hypothetical protein